MILMIGIVTHRAATAGPGYLTCLSIGVWIGGYVRLNNLQVESLCWEEVTKQQDTPETKGCLDAKGNVLQYSQRIGKFNADGKEDPKAENLFMKGCTGPGFCKVKAEGEQKKGEQKSPRTGDQKGEQKKKTLPGTEKGKVEDAKEDAPTPDEYKADGTAIPQTTRDGWTKEYNKNGAFV